MRMRVRRISSISLLAVLIAACCFGQGLDVPGGGAGPGPGGAPTPTGEGPLPPGPGGTAGGSCDTRARLGSCTEYVAGGASITLLGTDLATSMCQATSGTWSSGPCPSEGRLGVCTPRPGSPGDGATAH